MTSRFSRDPSIRERRLLFRAPPVEVAEKVVDSLKESTPQARAELQKLLDDVDPAGQAAFEAGFKNKLTTLPDIERQKVQENVRELAKTSTHRQLEALKRGVGVEVEAAPSQQATPEQVPVEVPTEEQSKLREWLPQTVDVREWNWKQAATATLGIAAGALIIRSLYRWWKGEKKSSPEAQQASGVGGFLKKFLMLTVVGGLAWGGYKMYHNWEEVRKYLGKGKEAADSAAGVVKGGIGAVEGFATEGVELGTRVGGMGLEAAKALGLGFDHLRKGEVKEAVSAFVEHGGGFVQKGGELFLYWSGRIIRLPVDYTTELMAAIRGEGNLRNFASVACSFGTLYIFNDVAANVLLNGIGSIEKYSKLKVVFKFIGAPAWATRDVIDVGLTVGRSSERAAAWLKLKSRLPTRQLWVKRGLDKQVALFRKTKTNETFMRAQKSINDFGEEIRIVKDRVKSAPKRFFSSEYGPRFSEEYLRKLEQIRNDRIRAMKHLLQGMQESELPADASSELRNLWQLSGSEEGEFAKQFGRQLRQMTTAAEDAKNLTTDVDELLKVLTEEERIAALEANAAGKAGGTTTTVAEGADDAERAVAGRVGPTETAPGAPLKKAAGAEGMAGKPAPQVAPSTASAPETSPLRIHNPDGMPVPERGAAVASTVEAGKEIKDVQTLMQELRAATVAGDEARVTSLLNHTLLRQAQAAGNPEATMLLKTSRLAKLGRIVSVAGKALGVLGALATVYEGGVFFIVTRPQLLAQRERERDPAKRAQIDRELQAQPVRVSANAVGMSLTFTPLAPAGLAILAASEGSNVVRGSIEEGTSYMLQTARRMAGRPDGALLQEVARSAPGTMVSRGQAFAAIGERGHFETANTTVRGEAYDAYFRNAAPRNMGVITPDMFDDASAPQGGTPERRAQTLNDEQVSVFGQAGEFYIREATGRTFAMVDTEILRRAESYARLVTAAWRMEALGWSLGPSRLPAPGKPELEERVTQELRERSAGATQELVTLAKEQPAAFRERLPLHLLASVAHDLAALEQKIIARNYSNILSLTGWRHWASDEDFRQAARGLVAFRVAETLRQIGNMPPTAENIVVMENMLRQQIASLADADPDALAKRALRSDERGNYAALGADPQRLTIAGIRGVLGQQ